MVATDAACATRLHDLTWQCQAGDFTALRHLLAAQGRKVTVEGRLLTVQGPPMTVALLAGSDPLCCFTQCMFALFGEAWPLLSITREALIQVHQTWHAATQAHRRAKRTRQKTSSHERHDQ